MRPTVIEIDLSAFAHNLGQAKKLAGPDVEVMAVIKANAYGHGSVRCAQKAVAFGCLILGVATVEEGLELRKAGVEVDILVLGGIPLGAEASVLHHRLSAVLFDGDSALRLNDIARKNGRKLHVHLKVDTGMGRLGFLPDDIGPAAGKIRSLEFLEIDGVMSHYARADEPDPTPTEKQIELFERALEDVREAGVDPRWVHCSNSAALLQGRGPRYNLVRPGIMLYGVLPTGMEGRENDYNLKPVLSLRTEVIQLRTVPDGWPISYGGRYVASGQRKIAVIPIGYADGFLRYNSGGDVLVRGRRAGIAGVVCMDLSMVDVTGIDGVSVGDEVVLIGCQAGNCLSAGEVGRRGATISYEVFCSLSARVPRHYLNEE